MKPQLHRSFRFSYIRDCSCVYHATVPAMLDAAGRKSHAIDCDVANIVRILLTLKILSRKVSENHLYAYAVVAVQDDFSVHSNLNNQCKICVFSFLNFQC